jgi:hypothetical protein
MSIESEVQALTQATTDLLTAVNVRKTVLDASVTEAEAAAAQSEASRVDAQAKAELLGAASTVTATAAVALTASSAVYQFINPNGANRDVTLPTLTAPDDGRPFCIKNTGTLGNALTVRHSGVQVGFPVGNGFALTVIWTGTKWEAV